MTLCQLLQNERQQNKSTNILVYDIRKLFQYLESHDFKFHSYFFLCFNFFINILLLVMNNFSIFIIFVYIFQWNNNL